MNIRIIKQIDCSEWDRVVKETYGKPYCFQQQDGCKSRGVEWVSTDMGEWDEEDDDVDTIPELINGEKMGVSFQTWLNRDPLTPLNPTDEELKKCGYYNGKTEEEKFDWCSSESHRKLFWYRNFYPSADIIAHDLCKRGLLEPGDYQINIDW